MNKLTRGIALTTGLLFLGLWSATVAADQHKAKGAQQEMLAEMWVMVPKKGKMSELEQAMQEHLKFRRSKQDPREWRFYSPVLGSKLERIGVRAGGFTWKDMDSYRDWSMENGVSKHFQETAGEYLDHYHHYLSVEDYANSHWEPDVEYRYVGVTSYTPKMGHRQAIEKDKKMLADAAKAQKWPYHWAFSNEVGGRGEMTLAVPYKNWGAMAPPEEKFPALLTKHMGSEEKAMELMERWSSHFEDIHYNIWALRDDLME
ncbi:hypothetical protein [Alteromonas halophila]|uniref:Uncharacterized protein n=1 Tax=Alteromonas halophila TaxID=516698 RepID=A0A918MY32_9ALTE|nr:hypothetical protein [Alteromonas halophila]GGW83471.1 hypothetical protein GCM10007391_16200 [Alteromonas halophila]